MSVVRWHAPYAALPSGFAADVLLESESGRFSAVTAGVSRSAASRAGAVLLRGLVLPGFANGHSHAFHRALRGRTHDERGSFWSWRERMYNVAERLDPDSYLTLAQATYAEMVLAGVSAVGEFHYLHHQPGGHPYDDPNAMGRALITAAEAAGIRLTLLDTCYLEGGFSATGHLPLDDRQRGFSDVDVVRWTERCATLSPVDDAGWILGAAIHSVRAVKRQDLGTVVDAARGKPLHVHLSEQPRENAECVSLYGITPTSLLEQAGALGPATTVVHATHVSADDRRMLGSSGSAACVCPTTERDLGDGIGPARALLDAGSPVCVGSDQHAAIDIFEEARALEMNLRLATGERGHFLPAELLTAMTEAGHRSLGWNDAGRLEVGARADLVAVDLDTIRTAGSVPSQVLFAAGTADIHAVVVDGRTVVADGQHVLGDVGQMLRAAIDPLWTDR